MADREIKVTDDHGNQLVGPLSPRHKLAIRALGSLFIWIGRIIRSIENYEDIERTFNLIDTKIEKLEEEHKDDFEGMTLHEETENPQLN